MTALLLAAVLPAADVIETTRHLELGLTVVEAVEDGPIIFEVTLTNRGPRTLEVEWSNGSDSEIAPPAEWAVTAGRRICGSRIISETVLRPGQTWTERFAPHVEWVGWFPAGAAPVTVSWPLRARSGKAVADPVRTFPLTLAPATPATLAAVARRVEADLALLPREQPTGRDAWAWRERVDRAADRVRFSRHPGLTPVVLKFLDWCPIGPNRFEDDTRHVRRDLVWTVFAADPATAHRLFVNRLAGKTLPADPATEFEVWADAREDVFRITRRAFWHEMFCETSHTAPAAAYVYHVLAELNGFLTAAPRLLPADELNRLAAADDFWVRALTFAAFADRLDPAWNETFLRDVRGRWPGPPAEVVRQLVRDLGHERYAVRNRADRQLRSHGHAVAPELRATLTMSPSPEVRRRAEAILAGLDGEPLDRRAGLVLASLYHEPGAGRLLVALAAGPDTDPVTKAARQRRDELAR